MVQTAVNGAPMELPEYVLQRREVLLIALVRRAQQDGLSQQALALELQVSVQYLSDLLLGCERVECIDAELAQAMAAFLGWPVIFVWLAAGAVRLQDFFTDVNLEQKFAHARARWPELHDGSAVCAVLALLLCGEEVVSRKYLRAVVTHGQPEQAR